jgi:predicted nucleic acid-binding protein
VYLLDTDIIRYSLYHPENYPYLIHNIKTTSQRDLYVSIVTAQELLAWRLSEVVDGRRQGYPAILRAYQNLYEMIADVRRLQIVPFEERAYQMFLRMPRGVGVSDRRIAATALANNFRVVTNNRADFTRIQEACPELELADWITPPTT